MGVSETEAVGEAVAVSVGFGWAEPKGSPNPFNPQINTLTATKPLTAPIAIGLNCSELNFTGCHLPRLLPMNLNRRLGKTLLWAAFIALGLISTAQPALAHDDLIGSSPASGETIEAGVVAIELEFSDELLTIDQSAEIIVLDPNGALVNNGCAVLSGRFSTTAVDVDQVGVHTVSWRAVSSDGHPIEGSFEFEVTNTTGHESAGIVPGTECDWAVTDLANPGEADGSPSVPGWVYWLLWLILPVAGIAFYLWLRPRPKSSSEPGGGQNQ